jgi:amino acid transporter
LPSDLVSVFSHNPHSVPFTWSWFSWHSIGGVSGFVAASLIAVYMFSGWDTGILVNEETSDAREKPGQSVVTSVIVLALMAPVRSAERRVGAAAGHLGLRPNPFAS